MRNESLFRVGVIGSVIAALCCFTPILVVLLGALGLGGLAAGLDWVLLPVLAGFLALTAIAWLRRRRAS